ncbi:TPA: hypothetical protein DIS60_00280 [Patescibacteria group bacterium]|nr:hypothetical protein [Patescibacteria group bacterium]
MNNSSVTQNRLICPLITLSILVFYNLARLFCSKYCMQTQWYQRILFDNLHHYQLGVILVIFSFMFLRNKRRLHNILIALGVGMVIDESMYVLSFLGLKNFTHYHLEGIIFEFLVFLFYAYAYLQFSKK